MRFSPLYLLLSACGPIQLDGGDETESTDTDTGIDSGKEDTNETEDTAAGLRPEVLAVEFAICEENIDDEPTWSISLVCTDPQGAETLGFGYAQLSIDAILQEERYDMVCSSGRCSVGWTGAADEDCAEKGTGITITLVCIDKDGHESFPYEVPW